MGKSIPSENTTPMTQPTDPARYKRAVELGKEKLKAEGSKAAAAREIFKLLQDEPREVVLKAFIEGATVTEKGSPTYYYNISRKFKKAKGG